MRNLQTRLRRLERTMQPEAQFVVVWGRDKAEHCAQIEKLQQAGLIDRRQDQIVRIMCFDDDPVHPPKIDNKDVTLP